MSNKANISLIIPCRNEAEGIGNIVKQAIKLVDEVIVVDNRSSDQTALVAKQAGARVIKENRVDQLGIGYGYSLLRGMKAAKNDLIATVDGDGTYPFAQIKSVARHMKREKLDMLLCSRFPLLDGQVISWWRQLGVWLLNTETRLLYGYPMQDVLSGMWMIKKSTLASLKLKEGGWNLSPEIKLAAVLNKNLRLGQLHIHHYEREFGQSKQKLLLTGLEHLWFIFVYRLKSVWLGFADFLSTTVKPWKLVGEARS